MSKSHPIYKRKSKQIESGLHGLQNYNNVTIHVMIGRHVIYTIHLFVYICISTPLLTVVSDEYRKRKIKGELGLKGGMS